MSCLFDPVGCVQSAVYAAVVGIPWWVFAGVALVALGVAWRLAGLPGIVAAAAAIGYALGRTRVLETMEHIDPASPDAILSPKKPKAKPKPDPPENWIDKAKRGDPLK